MESTQMLVQTASAALISGIWQGCVLAAAISLCLKLAPRISAGVRFAIWSALFFVTAMLPAISTALGHSGTSAAATIVAPNGTALSLDPRWAFAIAALWAMLVAVQLLKLARSAARLRGVWKRSIPVALTPALRSMLASPGLRQATLCTSAEIEQPCVIGFLEPRILVPGWLLENASPSELEQIVLHESAHLRRVDDWTNLLQKLAVACFPLNPALLWIERRLCAERELACDERVVRATGSPREYAACLTNLAEKRLSHRTMAAALALGALGRRSQLTSRIESILSGTARPGPLKTGAVALSLMAITVGGAIKLGSTAQLVSFATPATSGLALTDHRASTGPHYQNVVFHPKATGAAGDGALQNDGPAAPAGRIVATVAPPKPHANRPAGKHPARRNAVPADGVESIVIVTRWQTPYGGQMTRIDQLVRLSSAAPPAGWFVVQL